MPFEVLRLRRGSPGPFELIHCMCSVDRVSRYSVVSHTATSASPVDAGNDPS